MEDNRITKIENNIVKRVSNVVALTNKLLANSDTGLIPCTPDKKIVIDCIYDEVQIFLDGLSMVKFNSKWGFIDSKGKILMPFKYEKVKSFYNGCTAIKVNGKWGFIDKNGRIIKAPTYDLLRNGVLLMLVVI